MMAANEKTQPVINSRVSDRLGMVGGDPFSHIFRSLRQLVELGPQEWDITAAQKKNFKLLVANNPILRERSFRLGAEVYQKMGFVGENSELLYSNFDARPDTFVLLVENEERKDVATLTIVCDSDEDGLPLDDIYLDEADRIRARGRRTAEIVRLAVDDSIRGSREVLVHLFNFAFIYARYVAQCDDFVITVNPHHAAYYGKLLGFKQIGEERACPKVQNAPAVLLHLPLEYPTERIRRSGGKLARNGDDRSLYPFFYTAEAEPFIAAFLRHRHMPMTVEEIERFGLMQAKQSYTNR
jgi:hypothetical protein